MHTCIGTRLVHAQLSMLSHHLQIDQKHTTGQLGCVMVRKKVHHYMASLLPQPTCEDTINNGQRGGAVRASKGTDAPPLQPVNAPVIHQVRDHCYRPEARRMYIGQQQVCICLAATLLCNEAAGVS